MLKSSQADGTTSVARQRCTNIVADDGLVRLAVADEDVELEVSGHGRWIDGLWLTKEWAQWGELYRPEVSGPRKTPEVPLGGRFGRSGRDGRATGVAGLLGRRSGRDGRATRKIQRDSHNVIHGASTLAVRKFFQRPVAAR